MGKQILFGSTNPAKIDYFRSYVRYLPITVLSPKGLGIHLEIEENGGSTQANTELKAKAYYAVSQVPTIAIDAGLSIEKFPNEKQPGLYVRRSRDSGHRVTDEELLSYYVHELNCVGGESWGNWQVAIVLVIGEDNMQSQEYTLRTLFTSKRSGRLKRGAPLSSLMVDLVKAKYYSEMADTERPEAGIIYEFVKRHVDAI